MPVLEVTALPHAADVDVGSVAETLVTELGLAEGNAFVTWDEVRKGQVYAGGAVMGA